MLLQAAEKTRDWERNDQQASNGGRVPHVGAGEGDQGRRGRVQTTMRGIQGGTHLQSMPVAHTPKRKRVNKPPK